MTSLRVAVGRAGEPRIMKPDEARAAALKKARATRRFSRRQSWRRLAVRRIQPQEPAA
jgi:hypothetical protein